MNSRMADYLKNKRSVLISAIILTLALVLSMILSLDRADALVEGDYEYTVSSGYATITGYTGTDIEVVIPDTLNGYPVDRIGNSAFQGNTEIISITIPDSVTACINTSFSGCSSLTNITLSKNMTGIGQELFLGCTSLKSIVLPETATYIGSSAFSGCTNLESIIIPQGVTLIQEFAFKDCQSLRNITIPNSVNDIGRAVFNGCSSLEELSIPFVGESRTATNNQAVLAHMFGSSNSSDLITINSQYTSYNNVGSFETGDLPLCLKTVNITDSKKIPYGALDDCSTLTSITINEGVTEIGYCAFRGCKNIKELIIPSNVQKISSSVFANCSGLESLKIPFLGSSRTAINEPLGYFFGSTVYPGCNDTYQEYESGRGAHYFIPQSLKSVEITNASIIPNGAFYNCTEISRIIIPNTVGSIGNGAFFYCSGLTNLSLPVLVSSIGSTAFQGCSNLLSIAIPNGIETISSYMFGSCSSLKAIVIPESVHTIESNAFYNCTGLTNVVVPDSVSSIGWGAFRSCNSIKSITVPFVGDSQSSSYGLEYIFGYGDTTKLHPEYVPSTLKTVIITNTDRIPDKAFWGCANISSITIPNNVNYLGNSAFAGCVALSSFEFPSGITRIENSSFEGCNSIVSISIPNNVASIGQNAFSNCASLKNVTLAEGLKTIEALAFSNCDSLISILIPQSVSSFDGSSLQSCEKLEKVVIYPITAQRTTVEECLLPWEYIPGCTMSISAYPTKTKYIENVEQLDLGDATLEITFNDLTDRANIVSQMIINFDNTIVGEQTVLVSFGGLQQNFDVEVLHQLKYHDAQSPTCESVGWHSYEECLQCDYTTYEEIAALGHELETHEAKEETCVEVGWNTYDTCSRCDYTTYEEIDALGHDVIPHSAQDPTCTEFGWDEYDTCSRCDFTTYVEKPELGHDLVRNDAKTETCTEIGWDEYDTCSRCDYTTYIEKSELGHELSLIDAKQQTTSSDGNILHWHCSRCDKNFEDEQASIELDSVVLPAFDYRIVYQLNGGIQNSENADGYNISSKTALFEPRRTGYQFNGWYTTILFSSSSRVDSIESGSVGDKFLFAKWTANAYYVKFNANGGTGTMAIKTLNYGTKTALTKNAFTKKGFRFVGWNTEPDGTGDSFANAESVLNLTTTQNATINMYAQWEAIDYTMKYVNVSLDETLASGNPIAYKVTDGTFALSKPERTGYVFVNWYKDSKFKTVASTTILNGSTGDKTYYAKWTPITYALTFVKNADGVTGTMTSQTLTYGKAVAIKSNAYAKKGYKFIGWALEPDGEVIFANKQSVKNLTENNKDNITLYAKWELINYDIKYVNVDEDELNGNDLTYTFDDDNYYLVDPVSPGRVFNGWYKDSSLKTKATTVIPAGSTGTKTFYAKWTANHYKVVFNKNVDPEDATQVTGSMSAESFTYGISKALTSNAYVRKGYALAGWATEPNGPVVFANKQSVKNLTTVDGEVINLYAVWEVAQYTITYKNVSLEESEFAGNPVIYTYFDEKSILLNEPQREGYTFAGWYKDSSFKTKVTPMIQAGSTGAKTFYAKWVANTYYVIFNANTGSGKMSTKTLRFGAKASLTKNAFTKKGYKFVSWNTEPDGSGETYANAASILNLTTEPMASINLFAQWQIIDYTVKYVNVSLDETHAAGNPNEYKVSDETFVLNKPERVGYSFVNWYKDSKFKTVASSNILNGSTGNKTYYAKWTPNTYYVKFDANSGNGTMSNQKHTYNKSLALSANTFTKKGYTFVCWNTEKDGSGIAYANKASVSNLASENGEVVTLYAQWNLEKYSITYYLNGGIGGNNPTYYNATSDTIVIENPTRPNASVCYAFSGWFKDSTFKTKASSTIPSGSSGNVKLYAKWTKQSKHTFVSNEPTNCTDAWIKVNRCTGCGYTYEEMMPAEHMWVADMCGDFYECKFCNEGLFERRPHEFNTKTGICSICKTDVMKILECHSQAFAYVDAAHERFSQAFQIADSTYDYTAIIDNYTSIILLYEMGYSNVKKALNTLDQYYREYQGAYETLYTMTLHLDNICSKTLNHVELYDEMNEVDNLYIQYLIECLYSLDRIPEGHFYL